MRGAFDPPTQVTINLYTCMLEKEICCIVSDVVAMASFFPVSGEKPTLPELLKIKLPSRVGPKLQTFSTLLLQDKFGDIVSNIIEDCRGKTESVIIEVLREWLAGKGVEVSWESLIATLRECELPLMAKQIQMALEIKNPPC